MSVLINSVFTLMIQNYDWIFMQDNNLNPLTASNIPWLTSIFNESVTSLNSMNNDEDADFDDQYEKTIERIGNILEVDEKEVFDLDNVRVNEGRLNEQQIFLLCCILSSRFKDIHNSVPQIEHFAPPQCNKFCTFYSIPYSFLTL